MSSFADLVPPKLWSLPAEVEPSDDLGPKPEFKWIHIDDILVDPRYQRPVADRGRRLIKKIIENFKWHKFQPLVVAPIGGGKYSVPDGQHRLTAAHLHPKVDKVPCYIVDLHILEAHAAVFMALNRDRISLTHTQLFYASVTARDPDALHLKDVISRAGVTIPRYPSPGGLKPRSTVSVTTLYNALKKYGDGPVVPALKSFVDAYPETPNQMRQHPVKGVIMLFVHYRKHPNFSYDRVVETLCNIDLPGEVERAREDRLASGNKMDWLLCQRLVRAYNRTNGKSLPPKEKAINS